MEDGKLELSVVATNDLVQEEYEAPCPPRMRLIGDPPADAKHQRKAKKTKTVVKPLPRPEELELHPNHLPFFSSAEYDRVKILRCLSRSPNMLSLIGFGSYYIENDWNSSLNTWTEQRDQFAETREQLLRRQTRDRGRVNRIVALFMDHVLGFFPSSEMFAADKRGGFKLTLLWLGRNLAKRVLFQVCREQKPKYIFSRAGDPAAGGSVHLVNRLAVDVFLKDKAAFFHMLRPFMMCPSLGCTESRRSKVSAQQTPLSCQQVSNLLGTVRRVCAHQNLSMTVQPCRVRNCANFDKKQCGHIYAFVPEVITITSNASALHFQHRFDNPEDLKGCVFLTKPSYLENGRGIKFIVSKEQFVNFYHAASGKSTPRHAVLLQRYVENPRLVGKCKFTLRFFVHIVVLPKRRVLAFLHFGVALVATKKYEIVRRVEFEEDETEAAAQPEPDAVPLKERSIGGVASRKFDKAAHLTNYMPEDQRQRLLRLAASGKAELLAEEEDNCYYLSSVLCHDVNEGKDAYIQIIFVANRIMEYVTPIVRDHPGTFQTVSVDCILDSRNKLWVLGPNSKLFTNLLPFAPRQRSIMSAIVQETIGLTVECFYKTIEGHRLNSAKEQHCLDPNGFYFSQHFQLFFDSGDFCVETAARPEPKNLRVEQRFEQVDHQLQAADKQRRISRLKQISEKQNELLKRRRRRRR